MRPGSKGWKKFMAKLYGFGAAIVIVGALFKIQHWPGAGIMLTVGLSTEAIIFFFSAFEPIHEEIDWSLVYPELAGLHGESEPEQIEEGSSASATESLDKMLEEAKIGPELINSLGEGMRNLTDTTKKISEISDAHVATNEYVDSVKNAKKNVDTLSDSYNQAAKSLLGFSMTSDDSATFSEQMNKVSKNLSALNASYELQLQGAGEHMKTTQQFYENINKMMANLSATVQDTQKYKEEIAELSNNLAALNNVYGNMLSAMNVKK
ncbi:MAG TPA: gliding motility protein GldL [Bacteroidia bacterium]|jgi:gliding motility-associated protein GldL